MIANGDGDIPEWKREVLRRRQCKSQSSKQLAESSSVPPETKPSVTVVAAGQQPGPACNSSASNAALVRAKSTALKCNNVTCSSNTMVQERTWTDHKQIKAFEMVSEVEKCDSDSSEELKYGPGIVSRLKNRYLNLTLRENTARSRPSILSMRKAASLENMLDDDDDYEDSDDASSEKCKYETGGRLFETRMNGNSNGTMKNAPNRYKNASRRYDMKRARSVEIISSCFEQETLLVTGESRPKSLHEEMLIKTDGSDKMFEINDNKTFSNNIGLRLNRPKRLMPIMSEKEKPPADVVKQTKKLFERPELRTRPPHQTGEVAAKIATYKTIIVQTKTNNKKPPIKQKPTVTKANEQPIKPKQSSPNEKVLKPPAKLPINNLDSLDDASRNRQNSPDIATLPSPNDKNTTNESELNGFIGSSLTQVPDLIIHSSHPITKATTGEFIQAEIDHSNFIERKNKLNKLEKHQAIEENHEDEYLVDAPKKVSLESQNNLSRNGNSMIFNFSGGQAVKNHLPNISQSNTKVPINQPLKVDVGFAANVDRKQSPVLTQKVKISPSSPQSSKQPSPIQPTYKPPELCKLPSPQLPKQPSPQLPKQPPPQRPKQPSPQLPKQPSPQLPKQPSPQLPKQPSPQLPKQPSPQLPKQPSPQLPKQPSPQVSKQTSPQTPKEPSSPPKQLSPQTPKQPSSPNQLSPQIPKSPPKKPPQIHKQPPPQIPKQPTLKPEQTAQVPKEPQKPGHTGEIPTQTQPTAQIPKPSSPEKLSSPKPANSKQQAPVSEQLKIPRPSQKPKQPPAPSMEPKIRPKEVVKSGAPSAVFDQVDRKAVRTESLSDRVAEKNLINASKSVEKTKVSEQGPQKIEVPRTKRSPRPKQEQNSLVFNFTNRKDVPDYVGNDGRIKTGKIEKPKPGEGGITLMPGATLDESLVDDDEDWLRSLQGPPSPCNVTFVNDNVLIDGRSSLSQKTKKPKMRIQFVDGPDIFEYPSEASLLEDHQVPTGTPSPASSVGHAVPSLSGSTLANYTPKSALPEEFQLGMKPHAPAPSTVVTDVKQTEESQDESLLHETEQPVLFSSGTNSDILF